MAFVLFLELEQDINWRLAAIDFFHRCTFAGTQPLISHFQMRQLDAGLFKEYKLHNHPVGACQIITTIDKINNRLQERKRLRPLFSCLRNYRF